MDIYSVRPMEAPIYGIKSIGDFGGKSSDSFQQQLGRQRKEHFRSRVVALFEEITEDAASIIDHVDLSKFEKYRGLIGNLLSEVVQNAYSLCSERVLDRFGRHRLYASISIIDKKLENMAKDILNKNGDRIDYISRVDEIRGLVMDLLL